ncbi:MAG: alpha/beta hydrolase family protein [Nocardioidaceae bacterium]
MLQLLAERGLVAVTFDLPGHGSRADRDPTDQMAWVLSSFRRRMWPLLGQATLESLRVLDWMREKFSVNGALAAGGVSMGGDIAVALAGVHPQLQMVSAIAATPDWTRPGMRRIGPEPQVIDQGRADSYAQWFYDRLDPLSHWQRFRRDLRVQFLCGTDDRHVPPEAAYRFMEVVNGDDHDSDPIVTVCDEAGTDHVGMVGSDAVYDQAADWLARHVSSPRHSQ